MSLPSREDAKNWSDRYADVVNYRSMVRIVAAYGRGDLMTAEEAKRKENADLSAWEEERGL